MERSGLFSGKRGLNGFECNHVIFFLVLNKIWELGWTRRRRRERRNKIFSMHSRTSFEPLIYWTLSLSDGNFICFCFCLWAKTLDHFKG